MKIALTGGGTAGHAMVGSVLIPMLADMGWNTIYIGSINGAERKIIKKQGIAKYYAIPTGKLRRYFSFQNLLDPFKIVSGIVKAYSILKKERPHIIFSGGGYVGVPVVVAAKVLGIPILLRETDYTIGMANKICSKLATSVTVTFPDTAKQIKNVPVSNHGMIVKPTLLQPSSSKFIFENKKPTILVMGGSLGAAAINMGVKKDLHTLLSHYNIIHLCGNNNIDTEYDNVDGYMQLPFLDDMAGAYQAADYLLMRCGSNAVCEALALGKPMICVPLTKSGSRGEQYDNAEFAVKNGNGVILDESRLCARTIMDAITNLTNQVKNVDMKLTSEALYQNCMAQIAQLNALGLDRLHQDFVENIYSGKNIDFFSLSSEEILYYNELAEEYGM